jgi:hypothetical protein
MANYQMNYSVNKSNKVKVKVKMPIQKSNLTNKKMDKLVNFRAYLDYTINNLGITPVKSKSTFKPSYRMVIPSQCYCCSNTAKYSQLTCDKYDCAIDLLMYMNKKIYDDDKHHNILVSKTSNSCINGIYTDVISNCISHMIRSMKIKYTKNCVCCSRDIPFGLIVCRNVKCISKFILENGEKYQKFRIEYNKKYQARKRDEYERDYDDYRDDYDDDYRDGYDDDNRSDYSEQRCNYCNEGDGGGCYRGCDCCGTLTCGCIDVCRGRCGRDDYW